MHSDRTRLTELVTLVVGAAVVGLLLDGWPLWLAGIALGLATAAGAFVILAPHDPRGVPVESLALPAVAGTGTLGIAHLAGPTWAAVAALAIGGALVAAAVALEIRMLAPAGQRDERVRGFVVLLALVVAFVAFSGIAVGIPGGVAGEATGVAAGALGAGAASGTVGFLDMTLDERHLALLVAAHALVAFVLGYRLSALRMSTLRGATWSAGTFAVVIAIATAAIRALAVPRLLGPAALTVVFYLWSAYRAAPGAERRSAQWIWEYAVLAVAAAITVAWNLLLR
jgi:hypothetical protein